MELPNYWSALCHKHQGKKSQTLEAELGKILKLKLFYAMENGDSYGLDSTTVETEISLHNTVPVNNDMEGSGDSIAIPSLSESLDDETPISVDLAFIPNTTKANSIIESNKVEESMDEYSFDDFENA